MKNFLDHNVINDFGSEWVRFSNDTVNKKIQKKIFNEYFAIFPKKKLNKNSIGFDMGCGSGRWAFYVAPHVKKLYCIEPSQAIYVAQKKLKNFTNCEFVKKNIFNLNLKKKFDFGYCLGVLHHIQNTQEGLDRCVNLLKKNSPFLLYLYYNFENKSLIYKFLWNISNVMRMLISSLPNVIKYIICDILAAILYYPFAKFSWCLDKIGLNSNFIPLHHYKNYTFYHMRNDSLDRFGTKVEKRFSRNQIITMMKKAGLKKIKFSNKEPFWCVVGYKK